MTFLDAAFAILPGLGLMLFVGIAGDATARGIGRFSARRHNIDGLLERQQALRAVYDERGGRAEGLARELASIESSASAATREYERMRKAEAALANPENHTVFEIGHLTADCDGWYAKALLHRGHEMFGGLATLPTNSEGYRIARLVIWGVSQDAARQICAQRFSNEASLLSLQKFRGFLKIDDA
ncbi:hypothetical protein [Ferrovibrio sp.]|uniref:hypothetical protein n=1 Tax=Ferrovibrio sp. TaxID=1917215 RepID=UPI00311E937A